MEAEFMERFRQIYAMLEDDESRDIYLNRLNWLISNDFRHMKKIIGKYVPRIDDVVCTKRMPKDKPIILYGAGQDGLHFLSIFEGDPRLIGFCDRDKRKQEKGVAGYKVISPEELLKEKDVTIVVTTLDYLEEVKTFLLENGVAKERIYTPKVEYESGEYFNPDFMTFEDEEVFVDAGAYDLSTSRKLGEHCSRIRKIYAFEPDSGNYEKCVRNKEWFESGTVEVFPCGTWDEKKTIHFIAEGTGSKIADSGDMSVEVMPIDEVVDPSLKVTFIKMDVEGAELESLKGAKETIMRDKPKLAICIYHKPEDMLTLPWYIKSLVPEYKLYLRHHSNWSWSTILYAMP